jgi:hypothetical protein
MRHGLRRMLLKALCLLILPFVSRQMFPERRAPTRVTHFGFFATGEPLVTLLISEDTGRVRHECGGDAEGLAVLGCQISRQIVLENDQKVRGITIVRYTDALPSELAQEIDVHEMCHAVASLQAIEDPCHNGNGGAVQSAMISRPKMPKLVIQAR